MHGSMCIMLQTKTKYDPFRIAFEVHQQQQIYFKKTHDYVQHSHGFTNKCAPFKRDPRFFYKRIAREK
jgi:hypothetical protein